MFTKSNLAKLASPVLPNPIPNTRSHDDRNRDREKDAPPRWPILLVELVIFSGATQRLGLVELIASFTSCAEDSAVACGFIVLDPILIFLAEERVVWRWKVLDKIAMAILLTFIIPVTANY